MQWFLDDIGHSDWGVDVSNDNFSSILYDNVKSIYYNYESFISEIEAQQKKLWHVTIENMKTIKNFVEPNK